MSDHRVVVRPMRARVVVDGFTFQGSRTRRDFVSVLGPLEYAKSQRSRAVFDVAEGHWVSWPAFKASSPRGEVFSVAADRLRDVLTRTT